MTQILDIFPFLIVLVLSTFLIFAFYGSFLGVVIDRLFRGEQFLKGRSYCESCKHQLVVKDLIPLFSYIFLKGKCSYCKKVIPPSLFVFELGTGFTMACLSYYAFFNFYSWIPVIFWFVLLSVLLLVFFTDAKYSVILDAYLWMLLSIYIVFLILGQFIVLGEISNIFTFLSSHLVSALWLGVFFALLHFGSKKKAMGDGDIYLAFVLGLYLTFEQSLVMWFASFLTGALYGLFLIVLKKKKIKQSVPFGPFLIIGFLIALGFGDLIVNWYLNFLN